MVKHPFVGIMTFRLVIWLGAVIIAPIAMEKLSKQKEIEGEMDYFESLVLSLLLFGIAFTPFIFPRLFFSGLRKNFWTFAYIWAVAGFAVDGYVISSYKKLSYWKSLIFWLLTFVVSYTGGFVLASFSLFLLKTLR